MAYRRTVVAGGQVVDVEVHQAQADGGDKVIVQGTAEPLDVRPVGDGEYLVSSGSRRWRVWVAGSGNRRQVFIDGNVLRVDLAGPGSRPGAVRSGGTYAGESAVAPMPATIVEIVVEAGQQVRRGDMLLKLEAMKMEMPLRAPHDGRVAEVRCKPGDLVEPGALLVVLEENQDRTED